MIIAEQTLISLWLAWVEDAQVVNEIIHRGSVQNTHISLLPDLAYVVGIESSCGKVVNLSRTYARVFHS
jgi:hypothetical protein